MTIHLYNSLTRKKERFIPLRPDQVTMYNCGPTVYNYAHLGNHRAFLFADWLYRTLEFAGYSVQQVINITDVGHLTNDSDDGEDKIEVQARRTQKTAQEITNYYTQAFLQDLEQLNIRTNDTQYPKATEHIKEQIDLIRSLEQKGYTYKTSDGIYFNTTKLPHYDAFGVISDQARTGGRIEINSEKQNVADFALWKFSPPNQTRMQEWDSPWGVGFPGWHLECSAMAQKYLGNTLDIHTGGIDHKFPHHTNEIAQSTSVTDQPLANYWLHIEHVSIEGEKMAKSGENFITLNSLTERGHTPLAYRYWLLTGHYLTPMSFSWSSLRAAERSLNKLQDHVLELQKDKEPGAAPDPSYLERFQDRVYDDLDLPQAVAVIWSLVKDKQVKPSTKLRTLEEVDQVLGLKLTQTQVEIPAEVNQLLEEREAARTKNRWKQADELRSKIESAGFEVKDTPTGPQVKPISLPRNPSPQ